MDFSEGVIALRSLLTRRREHAALDTALTGRDDTLDRHASLFDPEHLGTLNASDFGAFVRAAVPVGVDAEITMTEDVGRLRTAVATLLDEAEPVARRIDAVADVIPTAVASTILLHVDPDRHSAWTPEVEGALMRLGLWTAPPSSASPGAAYATVSRRLGHLASSIPTDRWTLDALLRTHLSLERARPRPRPTTTTPPRPTPAPGRRTPTRSTAARPAPRPEFTCGVCFATKDARLRADRGDLCVDCA